MPKASEFAVLTPKQAALMTALLEGYSMKDASARAGIADRTARNYVKLPHFREAYRAARLDLVDRALARIQVAATPAANRLIAALKDGTSTRAAEIILKIALESAGLAALERRIEELEGLMEQHGVIAARGTHGALHAIS